MAQLTEFHAIYRLRGKYGDHKGLWVANMIVSNGGMSSFPAKK